MFTFSFAGKNVYIVQSSGRDTNNHLMDLILFIQVIGRNIKLQVDWYCMQKHKKNQQIISRLVFCEIKKHKKISKKNPLKLKTI